MGSFAMRDEISYRFTYAVVRTPSNSVANALRATDRGAPDVAVFRAEHAAYVSTLQRLGLEVTVLPALEEFPDSVFIEDTALCLPEGAIILRPGAASRVGEASQTATALSGLGLELKKIDAPGAVDGGDILVTGSIVLVGLSARTNQAGFESLRQILAGWGYEARAVHTPADVLHFKSDCNILDDNMLLCTSRLAGDPHLRDFSILTVPPGEEAAANSIRVNDAVLVPQGFPGTAELLAGAGFDIVLVKTSQAALADGGLSCMSLRL
jgi:dimethylargininase